MYIVKIRTGQIYRKLAKFLKFQKMKNPYGARMDDLKKIEKIEKIDFKN